MRVRLYLQMKHEKILLLLLNGYWRRERTFHEEVCGTGSAASIIGHEARIVPTLQWLHLQELHLGDKVFQRNDACLP